MAIIPIGRLTVATPETMAESVRANTVATVAIDERIEVVGPSILADSVVEAAEIAVGDAVDGLNVALRTDPAMPKVAGAGSLYTITDQRDQLTFVDIRASDGAPSSNAGKLIGRTLTELGLIGGGGGGGTDSPSGPIVCFGDSLTEAEAWTDILAQDTSVIVRPLGQNGNSSTEVAFRSGALSVGMTVTGNTIPASGSVAVTALSPSGDWRTGVTVPWSERGYLAGVLGTFNHQYTGNSGATFVRDKAGSAVACPPNTPFVVAPDVTTGVGFERTPVIIWAGRNNITNLATVQRDIGAMMSHFTSPRKLVLSVTNASNEPSGSTAYNQIIAINNWLSATYPTFYVDVRRWMIDDALRVMGLTPTTADTTAIGEDRIPPQLLNVDGLHITPATSEALGHKLAFEWRKRGL